MNLEICKKCYKDYGKLYGLAINNEEPEKQILYTSFAKKHPKRNEINISSIVPCMIPVKIDKSKMNGERIFREFYSIQEKTFKDIELTDKNCSYWLEHQLFDWNRKK